MPVQAEAVRRRAERALEARRGVAVRVQRTRELEDEADGERVRRLEPELGRGAKEVVAQGVLWADDGAAVIIYGAGERSSSSASWRITTSAELIVTRPVKRTTLATRLLSAQLAARGWRRYSKEPSTALT